MTEEFPPNQEAATRLGEDIDALLGQISAHELRLSHSYARLGGLLRIVKVEQYWSQFGYPRFSTYMQFVGDKIDRQRSQMYAILSVAEALSPYITEDQLEEIGITKAHELRRLVKGGLRPGAEISPGVRLMDYAAQPEVTAAKLRVEVNKLLRQEEDPQGFWYDLGGCYLLPDEKKEVEQLWEVGKRVVGATSEWSEHQWKKEVILAAAREIVGTYSLEEQHGGY